ncbi:hypothetical protein F383_20243 [Gossypium arboreum]|uniref:Uncharacterized protein n=1 Tax=Gossypium arboreum TaxID=29729 RepID=A0A0B0NS22_GOSAR|nr:hypothetical protein F383_20243 [Gossypium arboreum]
MFPRGQCSDIAMEQIENFEYYFHVSTMEQILATGLISLRSYLHVSTIEQIENDESYLHILAMEQILAIGLISLRYQENRLKI